MPHGLPLFIAIGLFSFLMPFWSRWARNDEQIRLARLESKVNLMLDKLGIEHDAPSDEVRDLVLEGKTKNAIQAIKAQIKAKSFQ